MSTAEIPESSHNLMVEAAKCLRETGVYTALAQKCYKGKSAESMALAICTDLSDIGMDCHVDGATITLDA
jgi:hypothetical protein